MAHTISPQRRHDAYMASTIDMWRDFDLHVTCGNCGILKIMPMADVPKRHDAQTMAWLCNSLRCRIPNCGGRASVIVMVRGTNRVTLRGPGAHG